MMKFLKRFLMIVSIFGLLLTAACANETSKEEIEGNDDAEEMEGKANSEDPVEDIEDDTEELFAEVEFSVMENEEEIGTFVVDVKNPQEAYELDDGVEVVLSRYYPDYVFEEGEPRSQSIHPVNPAFIFLISKDEHTDTVFVGIGNNLTAEEEATFTVDIIDYSLQQDG